MTKLAQGPDPSIFTDAVTRAVEAVLYTDIDETITYVNPAFTTITGYAPAEALGRTPRFLNIGEHSPEFFKNMWDQLRANHMWKGRIRNRHTDGRVHIAETTITAVMNARGNLRGYLSIALDVSQEAQLQEREATPGNSPTGYLPSVAARPSREQPSISPWRQLRTGPRQR